MRIILRSLMLVAVLFSFACTSLACSTSPRQPEYRLIAAPGDVVALAVLGNDSIALLGGNESSRNVSIEKSSDGSLLHRFGVTREADAIASAPGGAIYVGLASQGGGAVEEWSPDGRKRRTIPMPAGVVGFGVSERGERWAFVAGNGAFAALPVPATGNSAGRAVPLPAGTRSLAFCEPIREPSFVISQRDSHIVLVRIHDGATTDTNSVGDAPVCSKSNHALYALSRAGDATYISIVNLATLLTVRQVATMKDAVSLSMDPLGELIVFGRGAAAGAMRVYAPAARELRVGG